MDLLTQSIRDLHVKNREEISAVILIILKKHGITFDNPNYYKRCRIEYKQGKGKIWFVEDKPVFIEKEPVITHESNTINISIEYKELT